MVPSVNTAILVFAYIEFEDKEFEDNKQVNTMYVYSTNDDKR